MIRPRHGLPTERQELLLKAALLDGEAAISAWRRWQEVDAVSHTDADSLRMMPLLFRNLLGLEADDPEMEVLKSMYRHQWVANHHRLHRGALALRVLEGAGIETMVLKGAALAQHRYGDIGVRRMLDVDILVRTDRAGDASEVLSSSGWTQLLATGLEMLLPAAHGTLFVDGAEGRVDLHWHALWSPAVEDDFWDAAQPIEVAGASTLAQCPADQLLQACVHGIWSDGLGIRWVADAVAVLRSAADMDWDRLVERARARSLTLPLGEGLAYLRSAFGSPIPDTVMRSLKATPRGVAERAGHRAWTMAPATRRRTGWLVWERYRRQRTLPPGPTRRRSFRAYLRCWATMAWELDRGRPLIPEILRRLLPRAMRSGPGRH
jgi:hypothetical protein